VKLPGGKMKEKKSEQKRKLSLKKLKEDTMMK